MVEPGHSPPRYKPVEMNEDIRQVSMAENEAKKIFRSAYEHFRRKEYIECLNKLKPVLEKDCKVENDNFDLLSLMWGIAGDSLVSLKSIEDAIYSYRKSIELDQHSGCIFGYTWAVAKFDIINEAPFAYNCLISHKKHISSCPPQWRAFGKIFALLCMPSTWWAMTVRSVFVKRKLKKMIGKGL